MNASWEETNTYQRFGVTLAYRYHTYKTKTWFICIFLIIRRENYEFT
jgi:hypothetical protein